MRSPLLTSLLFAVFASTSVAVSAAPVAQMAPAPMAPAMAPMAPAPAPMAPAMAPMAPAMAPMAPAMAPMAPAMAPMNAMGTSAETSSMINLNTADAATLQKELNGIGSAKAQAIVAYRDANGEFASVDELLEVKGIGKAILDKNRDKLGLN